MQIQPRYTSHNCSAAYQLNWSLSVFGREARPSPASSIEELREAIAKDRVQELLESLQFHDAQVDLTIVRRSSHGEFRYALQVVIESESSWHDVRPNVLTAYRQAIIASCRKNAWLLSRIGLLSNHVHVLVGPGIEGSPMDVVLVLLNNIAFTQGLKPMFRYSFYVGTLGEYDRGAIWQGMAEQTTLPPGQARRN